MRHKERSKPKMSLLGTLVLGLLPAVSAAPAQAQTSYGYFRTVEGYADLIQGGSGSRAEVVVNLPLLTGERIDVSQRGRIEAVLADGNYLRIDGDTELVFDRLAFSGDSDDDTTLLRLIAGEIQLVLPRDITDARALQVDTVNATIYLDREGSYRITTDGAAWTEVLVREGYAEVTTQRGSAIVRAGEQVMVEGTRWLHVSVEAAAARDSLERWGDDLLLASYDRGSSYVDPSLAYEAAPLADHGRWVEAGGSWAWRPYVSIGWRPYWDGWWAYSRSGLTWVSHEPWGWITHHYGHWTYSIGHGWVWYPGYAYSPGAVYWYWGPSYVAWIPIGYYTSFYRPYYHHGFGLRFGIYGWAGGHASYFADWIFCPHGSFGYRHSHHTVHTGAELTRRGVLREVPRGIITTDTREVTPDRLRRPDEIIASLKAARARFERRSGASELPDVTEFVARRRHLSDTITRAVTAGEGELAVGVPGLRRARSVRAESRRPEEVLRVARAPSEVTRERSEALRLEPPRAGREVIGARREQGGRPSEALGSSRSSENQRSRRLEGQNSGAAIGRRERTKSPLRDLTPRREPRIGRTPGAVPSRRETSTRPDFRRRDGDQVRSWRERAGVIWLPEGTSRRFDSGDLRRGQTPPVRRVWEGVRSYRSRSRTDLGRPGGRSSGVSSSRSGDRSRSGMSSSRGSTSSSRIRSSGSSSRSSTRSSRPSSSRSSASSGRPSSSRSSTRGGSISSRRSSGSGRAGGSSRSSGTRRSARRGG